MTLDTVAIACRSLLTDSIAAEACRSYLDGRLNRDTQEAFDFGYFPGMDDLSLLTSAVGEDILLEEGLMYRRDVKDAQSIRLFTISFFEHHPIVMPYRDAYGRVIALVGRSLLNDAERDQIGVPKYKNTTFTKGHHLFGLNEAKHTILKDDCVYVVEGQFDVIKAFEKGLNNVVAVGSSNMSGYQLGLLCRYTTNIVLLFDNDDAGRAGADKAMGKFAEYAAIKNACLPIGYKDLDEFLDHNEKEELNDLI